MARLKDVERLERICARLPEVVSTRHLQHTAFQVRKKKFAWHRGEVAQSVAVPGAPVLAARLWPPGVTGHRWPRNDCHTPRVPYEHTFNQREVVALVATLGEPRTEAPMFDVGAWLTERRGLMDGNEAAWLDVLAEFDRDQGWALDGQLSGADWLMWRTKMARST